jgi:hypothetical protein
MFSEAEVDGDKGVVEEKCKYVEKMEIAPHTRTMV